MGSPGPHPGGGKLRGLAGGSPGPHPGGRLRGLARRVSRPTPRGEVEGSGWGVPRPTPRGYPGPCLGGVSQACSEADIPPSRRPLLRVVRILLECILVATTIVTTCTMV